jgi:hypothetical protein
MPSERGAGADRSYRATRGRLGGLLAVVLLTAAPMTGLAAAELLAHWPMDEIRAGVVADASGQGHDATAMGREGRLPQVVEALIPHGLRFTAPDEQYLEVKNITGLAAPTAFTVMAWIKPLARGGTYEIIGNKGDRSGTPPWPGWRLRYFWSRACFEYGAADGTEPRLYSPEWSVPAGLWSHVAATYDGKNTELYIDGEKLAESAVTQPILAATRPLVIGNYIGRKNAYAFDGVVDDLRVYAGVLSAEEIFAAATQDMR